MLVRVKGVKSYKVKGQWYHYHRATGAKIKGEPGSAAFVLEVARLDAKAEQKAPGGDIHAAIIAYKLSQDFADLAPATKVSYERAFVEIEKSGSAPVHGLTTAEIVDARDKVMADRGRWMANYFVTVLSVVLDFVRERGWIQHNPAKGIRKIRKDKSRPRANRPWEVRETRAVLEAAPAYLAVPIGLAMFAGFRKGDALSIGSGALVEREIDLDGVPTRVRLISHTTAKRRVDVAVPLHPTLANILALAPARDGKPLALNSLGEAWTESGFNSTFSKMIDRLEKAGRVDPGLTMHGLRHTVGHRLIEAGADLDMVERILGQQSAQMAKHYSRSADVTKKAYGLIGKMKVVG